MNIKSVKLLAVLTVFCAVLLCIGTVCSDAASKPGKVKSFQVKVSGTKVKLSWAKASGKFSSYVIYRNGKKIASVGRKKLKYTDKNRKYGKTYSYKVRAYRKDAHLYGRWSSTKKAVIRPGKVSGLKCTGSSSNQITLSWKKASGAKGYAIYRDGKLAARTKSTSYTDKGLKKASQYGYYIKSYVKKGRKYVYGKSSGVVKAATEGFPIGDRSLVDIYCAQTARDAFTDEDLEFIIDLIMNRLQPQAVEMLLGKFPCLREAADQGQIGRELSLYIYYKQGDQDGIAEHKNVEPDMMKLNDMAVVDGDNVKFAYLLAVDSGLFCMLDEDQNPLRDPMTGKFVMQREGESIELFKDQLTGEMLRAMLLDYNRTGMIGAKNIRNAVRNEEGEFPTQELADLYSKIVFPKWFTEGMIAAVEDVFRTDREQFKVLRSEENNNLLENYVDSENGFDLEKNVLTFDSEESCRVSGYLAVLYLAELSATQDPEIRESSIDENGVVSAEKLRAGLNKILETMHNEETLDAVINDISPLDSEGKKIFDNTETFEKLFVKGIKDGTGQYTGDQGSIDFVNTLLDYLEKENAPSAGGLSGGSILTDLKERYSPLDESGDSYSDFLQIVESNELVESTVPNEVALAVYGRSDADEELG